MLPLWLAWAKPSASPFGGARINALNLKSCEEKYFTKENEVFVKKRTFFFVNLVTFC